MLFVVVSLIAAVVIAVDVNFFYSAEHMNHFFDISLPHLLISIIPSNLDTFLVQ